MIKIGLTNRRKKSKQSCNKFKNLIKMTINFCSTSNFKTFISCYVEKNSLKITYDPIKPNSSLDACLVNYIQNDESQTGKNQSIAKNTEFYFLNFPGNNKQNTILNTYFYSVVCSWVMPQSNK